MRNRSSDLFRSHRISFLSFVFSLQTSPKLCLSSPLPSSSSPSPSASMLGIVEPKVALLPLLLSAARVTAVVSSSIAAVVFLSVQLVIVSSSLLLILPSPTSQICSASAIACLCWLFVHTSSRAVRPHLFTSGSSTLLCLLAVHMLWPSHRPQFLLSSPVKIFIVQV